MNLKWNVYYQSWNKQKITPFNIFDHSGVATGVEEALKKHKTKEEFGEELRRILQYFFWSRCEYELILSSWPPTDLIPVAKVDIYDQVMLNWDVFLDYVWNNHIIDEEESK